MYIYLICYDYPLSGFLARFALPPGVMAVYV